jgi:hypothetical protein
MFTGSDLVNNLQKSLATNDQTRIIRGLLATKALGKKFFKRQRLSNRGGCLPRYLAYS